MKSNEKYSFKSAYPIQSYFSETVTNCYQMNSPESQQQSVKHYIQDSQACVNSWQKYLEGEEEKNIQLKTKVKTVKESIDIYKQSLALKNEEILNMEMKNQSLGEKIVMLQKQIKAAEQKHKNVGEACQATKTEMSEVQQMITKEQNILAEEQRHADQIYQRMKYMEQEMNNSYSELENKEKLYDRYENEVEINRELKEKVQGLGNSITIIQHNQQKQQKEESIIKAKSDQLMKVVEMRQNRNKTLAKKLTELKRLNPEGSSKKFSVKELNGTLANLQKAYSQMHDELISFKNKTGALDEKIKEKNESIEKMREQDQSTSIVRYNSRGQPHTYNVIESEGQEEDMGTTKAKRQIKIPKRNIQFYIEDTDEQMSNVELSLSESAKQLIDRYERVGRKNKY